MTPPRPSRLRPLALSLGALTLAGLAGCDNPACVFGNLGCQGQGGSGGSSVTAATFPAQGEWILPGAPRVEAVYPQGTANPDSPIVVVFSESISPASISGAFELQQAGGLPGGPNTLTGSLVGDGRVLVLFPATLIGGSEYTVVWAEGSAVRDLTGSLALRSVDGEVGSFSVDDAPAPEPQVVMTWPEDSSVGQSPITEVVTVFDRAVDPTSVTPTAWRVRVNGSAPTFDPPPAALTLGGGFGVPATQDTRVWTWRSVDTATDQPASLGLGASVSIQLSPDDGTRITTPDGDAMAAAARDFTTQTFAPPSAVSVLSEPSDAIGLEHLQGVTQVLVQVDLEQPAVAGDVLEIYEFGVQPGTTGVNPDDPGGPPLAGTNYSLMRTFALDEGTASVVLNNNELQLVQTGTPFAPRFEDGDLGLAFAVSRAGGSSPVRVLDVDPDTDGIQDLLQDSVPPKFLGLAGLPAGGVDYRGDVRDLVVVGQADEDLRTVEVVAMLSGGSVDNRVGGALPPLPAMLESGDFIAAPVFLDAVAASELPVNFSVVLYDRALNASAPFSARWTQLGSTGPATALPGSGLDVVVTVYDAVTLAPLAGATVYAHEVVAGALTAFAPQPVTTDAQGVATIASAPTGDTIVTVERAGYDLFSFHDVKTTKLDVALRSEGVTAAVVQPTVLSPGEDLNSSFLSNWIGDSRVLLPGDTVHAGDACDYNPLTDQTVCGFAPEVIEAGRIGLLSFLSTKEPANQTDPSAFSAASFLQAFATSFPRPRVDAGGLDTLPLEVPALLSGAGVDPEDIPLGISPHTMEKPADFATSFPNPIGSPSVAIEVQVRGLPGSMTVGLGKSYFDALDDNWDLRAAYSALARAGGPYAQSGLILDERFLRAELVDLSGARSGVRRPLSTSSGSVTALPQPSLAAPAGSVTGTSYAITYDDVVRGPVDGEGLVRITLVDSLGRTWDIWQPDPVGVATTATAFLPPIDLAGGTPLASGFVTCVISAWSWPSFDPAAMLLSDPPREHDLFLTTAPVIWSQLP